MKAKAKAERAAARQVGQVQEASASASAPSASGATTPIDGPTDIPRAAEAEISGDTPPQPDMQPEPTPTPSIPTDRTELLRTNPDVVGQYMQLMVPVLIDVYAASVITPVRSKTLIGLLKAVSFLDGDGLKKVLTVSNSNCPLCTVLDSAV